MTADHAVDDVPMDRSRRLWIAVPIVVGIVALDQLTKQWALSAQKFSV